MWTFHGSFFLVASSALLESIGILFIKFLFPPLFVVQERPRSRDLGGHWRLKMGFHLSVTSASASEQTRRTIEREACRKTCVIEETYCYVLSIK